MYNLVQGDTALNNHYFVRGVSDPFFSTDLFDSMLVFYMLPFWEKI